MVWFPQTCLLNSIISNIHHLMGSIREYYFCEWLGFVEVEAASVVFVDCLADPAEPLWSYLLFCPLAIAAMKRSSLARDDVDDDATCFVKHVLAKTRIRLLDARCSKMRKVGRCRSFTSPGRTEKTLLKARQVAGQNAKTKTQNQLTAFAGSTVPATVVPLLAPLAGVDQ